MAAVIKRPPDCPYCQQEAKLVGGDVIYPHRADLYRKKFWMCAPCKAYVGCHPTTEEPLGRLADAELRKAKIEAHAAFDPLWMHTFSRMSRGEAYAWLAAQLGVSKNECHIGMFDVDTCRRVVEACSSRFRSRDGLQHGQGNRGVPR